MLFSIDRDASSLKRVLDREEEIFNPGLFDNEGRIVIVSINSSELDLNNLNGEETPGGVIEFKSKSVLNPNDRRLELRLPLTCNNVDTNVSVEFLAGPPRMGPIIGELGAMRSLRALMLLPLFIAGGGGEYSAFDPKMLPL